MKQTKKPLALLLALAIALALSAPAMAIGQNNITITGPAGPVPFGETFTLSAEVKNIPEGVEVVSYQWEYFESKYYPAEGATNAIVNIAPGDAAYPEANAPYYDARRNYGCTVTFAEKDTDGDGIHTFTLSSQDIQVTVAPERERNFGEILKESFEAGAGFAAMTSFLSGFFLLPFFPFTFVIGFSLCFFDLLFK